MSNTYFQIEVLLKDIKNNSLSEVIECATREFQCDGVEEFSMNESQVDEFLGERAYSGGDLPKSVLNEVDSNFGNDNSMKVLFSFCSTEAKESSITFSSYLNEKDIKHTILEKNEKDWNQEWRKHYKEIKVSEKLKIIPSWEKVGNKEDEIYIYPGMGFGTGDHETTFLCLKHFEELIESDYTFKTCFDFGCGSGILGIAAIKRAGSAVDFCDIDKNALDNCYQNLALNFEGQDLTGNTLVSREKYQTSKKYDLVFANILEGILIQEKELILASLGKNGVLIVSGILTNQIESILKEYTSLKHIKTYEKGDWASISFCKEDL